MLVIDDEIQYRRYLRHILKAAGYRVYEAVTGSEGLALLDRVRPDVVVLEHQLPDLSGIALVEQIRTAGDTAILVLSATTGPAERARLLDAGADDCLTKPFGEQELLARLRAMRRRILGGGAPDAVVISPLRIDLDLHCVWLNGKEVSLTHTEFALLRAFVRIPGRVIPHERLLREVWGLDHVGEMHCLRAYVSRLRRKLEPDPANPVLLVTEPGVGYRLRVEGAGQL